MKAGLTPIEAIQATTLVPARYMHLDEELGTIERGKRADFECSIPPRYVASCTRRE